MTADHVGRTLSRLLGPGWTAHTLRHRYASDVYGAAHDLRGVQTLLGHSSPVTTQIYTATHEASGYLPDVAAAMGWVQPEHVE